MAQKRLKLMGIIKIKTALYLFVCFGTEKQLKEKIQCNIFKFKWYKKKKY